MIEFVLPLTAQTNGALISCNGSNAVYRNGNVCRHVEWRMVVRHDERAEESSHHHIGYCSIGLNIQ